MDNVFMGQIVGSCSRISEEDGKRCAQVYFHDTESNACSKLSHYNKTYSFVLSDDVIMANDELLRLRDEMERLIKECGDWKARYSKANNELFQKGLAYNTLETAYKNEKIAGEMLLKDRDALKQQIEKLEAELTEIKTTRTIREAYITGVEKGCESLREERDAWKNRWNSVVTDIGKSLEANGIEFKLKEIHGDGNWDVVIDIPELTEAKAKVADLEKKLEAAKSNENYWIDRKEEEEDHHHYWHYTFNCAVKQAAEKGVHIDVRGTDEDCNAGVVVVDNMKAEELEKTLAEVRAKRDSLDIQNGSLKEVIYRFKNGVKRLEKDNDTKAKAVVEATDRGDYWRRSYDDLAEYWDNTRKDLVARGKTVGVKIEFKGDASDGNVGYFDITNEKAIELMVKVSDTKHGYNKKWQAMLDALKAKGVEVLYMGEENGKPIIDIKVPEWETDKQWVTKFAKQCADIRAEKFRLDREKDELKEQCDILRKDYVVRGQEIDILKKELEALKSRTLDNVEIRLSCGDIVWTYCDGFVHVSSGISGIISADEINTGHINCLCKNYFDAESISHGTVPKCSSCAHYMHNPSRWAHDWCYMPIPKEGGAGYIRKLSKEEAEGPACSDFKARKE